MNNTYKMMSKVSEHIETTNEDTLVEMYNDGEESIALARLFVINYGIVNKFSNKYLSVEEDIAMSIALNSLEKAIKDYSKERKSKLSTYFATIYKRDLVDEYRHIKADKRQINEDSSSLDGMKQETEGSFDVTYNDSLYYEDELDIDFYELDFLTDNEKRILSAFKECGFKANKTDIAERLDVHKSSISRAITRLKEKLPQLKEVLY